MASPFVTASPRKTRQELCKHPCLRAENTWNFGILPTANRQQCPLRILENLCVLTVQTRITLNYFFAL